MLGEGAEEGDRQRRRFCSFVKDLCLMHLSVRSIHASKSKAVILSLSGVDIQSNSYILLIFDANLL